MTTPSTLPDPDPDRRRAQLIAPPSPHALARVRALAHALTHSLAFTYDLARARDLARNLALACDLDLDHDLALGHARNHARDLARDLNHDLDPVRDLTRPIVDAFQSALTVTLGLTHQAASGCGRILGLRLGLSEGDRLGLSAVIQALAEIGDDFVGADLRSVQVHPNIVGLVGVRWSNDTQWPPEWVDYVRAASDEIEHGIFQITRTDGKHSPTYAAT